MPFVDEAPLVDKFRALWVSPRGLPQRARATPHVVSLPNAQAIISGLPGDEEIITNKGFRENREKTEPLDTSPDLSGLTGQVEAGTSRTANVLV
jgi:hypothetical protein